MKSQMPRGSRKKPLVKGAANILLEIHLKELGFTFSPEYQFHPTRKWKFDYLICHSGSGQGKTAIEIEGGVWSRGRHTRGAGYLGDMEKYNFACLGGYRVLRFTPDQILAGYARAFLVEHVCGEAQ